MKNTTVKMGDFGELTREENDLILKAKDQGFRIRTDNGWLELQAARVYLGIFPHKQLRI